MELEDAVALVDALAAATEARLDFERAKATKEALEARVVRLSRRLSGDATATDAEAVLKAGRKAIDLAQAMVKR